MSQRCDVAIAFAYGDEFVHRTARTVKVVQASHQLHQVPGLEKHQATRVMVIRQCSERLIAQRDVIAQAPMSGLVKHLGVGHVLVDPAESVDRDFLDEKLLHLGVDVLRCVLGQGFWGHVASSLTILARLMKDSERERF